MLALTNSFVSSKWCLILALLCCPFIFYGQLDGDPCNAIRWEGGATWNVDSSIDDTPSGNDGIANMAPANGIIRCGNSAETQSNIQSTGIYSPSDFTVDIAGFSCVEPSTGVEVFPANPTANQPIIWMNFDVRPLAGTFQVQINDNSGDEIAWALYYSDTPTFGVTLNPATGEYLSGDCSALNLAACGVESANTWNTLPVPDFADVTNYYLVIWDQDADGNLSVNNFKARFGCGDASVELCSIVLDSVVAECDDDNTFTVSVNVSGINGQFVAYDANALQNPSDPICLSNPGENDPVTSGTLTMTYNAGQMYSITVAEVTPSTIPGCSEPYNTDDCILTGISGMAPICCELVVECPNALNVSCLTDIPPIDDSDINVVSSCGPSTISTSTTTIGSGCVGDPYEVTYTYTVTDDENSLECQVVHQAIDFTLPSIVCPADATIDCNADTSPASTGSATGSDNCGGVTITFSDSSAPGCGNTQVITRTWTATDACGNQSSCDQTITTIDLTPPSIDCPADATIDCNADTSPASTGTATGSDNCGGVTITFSDSSAPGCGNTQVITRTWTATDDCGNQSSCDQTITTIDLAPPTIVCPADATIDCNADTSPASTGTATGSDNCGGVAITFVDSFTPGCGSTQVITRTWTATDACGNQSSCDQTITTIDLTPPSIDCPANATIDCNADTSPANTGSATGSDNCGGVTITFSDSSAPGCGNTQVIIRTWTATDACGNQSSCDQTITTTDLTSPTIDCPANATIDCNADTSPASTGSATGSDNCGGVTITFSDSSAPGCGNTQVITRTWTATDACGNQSSCDQTITTTDLTPPTIDCPADATVDCNADTSPASTGTATGSDNCGGVTITFSDSSAPGCGNTQVITRTWTATDDCGNQSSCDQTITTIDLTPPSIDCPADATIDCNADTSPASTGTATGSDNCGGVTITFSDSSAPGCGNTQVITRTWTATDDCGNQSSCDQTITTIDLTPPSIDCPADATIDCNADTSPASTGSATGSDNCGGVTITFSDSSAPGCGNTQVIIRTWTATDACGNQSSCDQTITTTDLTSPTIDCPADATIDCNADTSPASTGSATGSDNCGGVTITFSDSSAPGCGNTQVITRTWTATDACGNQSSCDQTITTTDLTPPTIDCPADATIDCNADTSPASTGGASGSDNCGGVTITFSDSSAPGCGNTQVITRTWTATDDCGNQSSCDQTITTIDLTSPTIDCPADATIDCNADTSPANTGSATGSDNCGGVTITFSDSSAPGCGNTQVITRTWTATDDCGNQSSCDQTITTIDLTPPSIDCPADATIDCNADTSPASTGSATGSDNCGGVTITFSDSSAPGCGNTQVIIRTWTATDACGNQSSCDQTITTTDLTSPTIDCPADATIDCNADTSPASTGSATGSDNCGGVTITFSDSSAPGCGNTQVITRTWTATDACGNQSSCDQTITTTDLTPPTIDCPADATVDCNADTSPASTGTATGADNCGGVAITFVDSFTPGCGSTQVITRTWTATDDCGNQSSCDQTITTTDLTPPTIDCPADATVDCNADTSPASTGTATGADNCGGVAITFVDSFTPGCGSTQVITRTWTATDACGNQSSCDQTITTIDLTPPSIDCPANATIDCNADTSPANTGSATGSDNCGGVTITFSDSSAPGCGNTQVITRTWTATDACGNQSSCDQTITTTDLTSPTIDCPADATIDCNADTSPASTGSATGSDNCGGVTITFSDSSAPGCGNTQVITRTWTATDDCGNQSSCDQTITTIDLTPPSIDCPADATIDCNADTSPASTGTATGSDNCGGVTITFSDSSAPGCGNTQVITRTWTATDACGNQSSCDQMITTTDLTPPTIDCPADATVDCNADTSPASTGTATGADNCGGVAITFVDSFTPGCGSTQVITRTWTATDDCGNQSSCEQTITTTNNTPPSVVCPPDVTIDCNADTSPASTGTATGSDNCGGATITFADNIAPGCGNTQVITRTWTATDDCGNQSSCDQTITTTDLTPPSVVCPPDVTIDCNADTSPAITGTATGSDNCGGVTITFSDSSEPGCGNTQVITRSWTATDDCGNQSSCDQTITTIDLTTPTIDCPIDATIDCNADTSPASTGSATGSDNCGGVTITFSDSSAPGCGNTQVITRTWIATDDCGNQSSCDQTITTIDLTPPSIDCPADATIDCNADTSPANTGSATGSDNCGGVTITFSDSSEPGCGNTQVITRTWTATDACGNSSSCDQTISTIDQIPPVLWGVPADVVIGCLGELPPVAEVFATDNCDAQPEVTFTESIDDSSCPVIYTRTWTATDDCGDSSSVSQTITFADDEPPVILPFDFQVSVECDELESVTIEATDQCGDVIITFEDVLYSGGCLGTISRTWIVTDLCGNVTTALQFINLQDTTPPVIHGVGEDMEMDCTETPELPDVWADDNCSDDVTLTFNEAIIPGDCPQNFTIVWTWTATDYCDLETVVTKSISISDQTPPVFETEVENYSLACGEEAPAVPEVSATDYCGTVIITMTETTDPGFCPQNYTLIRIWTATDECGNAAELYQSIEFTDNEAPVFTFVPEDVTFECSDELEELVAMAEDACGIATLSSDDEIIPTDCASEYTIVRTFTAVDECGNAAEAQQIITIIDTQAPEFNELPENIVIDCEAEIPSAPTLTALDACDGDVEVLFEETFEGDFPDTDALNDCQLLTAEGPYYDPDWALWLQGVPEPYRYYTILEGSWKDYPDGTAHIEATLVSTENSNGGLLVDVWFNPGMTWAEWSTQDYPTGYKDDFGLGGDFYQDWLYYIMDNNNATLTGWGDFDGSSFTLQHAPSNLYYAYQLGEAANNSNANYGSGGWFTFSGVLLDSSSDFNQELSGSGDFAFDHDCCLQYEVTWTWTATDCAGNSISHSATVNFEDLGGVPQVPGSPGICPADFDSDGHIGTSDLLMLLAAYGCWLDCQIDLNGDGLTTTSDMLSFLSAYGTDCD